MGLMSLFRRAPAAGETPKSKRASRQGAGRAADHEATVQRLRQQARRRLLGAAVLVGIGVIAFPIVFETQPRPVPMDLPIVIPAKDSTEPPRAAPASLPSSLPDTLPEAAELQASSDAAPLPDPAPPPLQASAPLVAQPKAQDKTDEAAAPASSSSARFVVQVGAFADKQAAQAARRKLEAKGLKTYAQVAKTKDGDRIRVRLGPFADRAEADKAAAKAKAVGLAGAVLTL